MMGYWGWIIGATVLIGAGWWGVTASNVEEARYEVVETQRNMEIRDYAPMIVAEVVVTGLREESISKGFRLIADYIFGNNASSQKVSMTAPVIQQKSEKIAMTAPVMQQSNGEEWRVRFVMPANYSMETLPKPTNQAVLLKNVESRRFAVVKFSGSATDDSLKQKTDEVEEFMRNRKLVAIASPVYAFYNPPWIPPFFRRNEIMVEIEKR